jgi:hypothetical protein
LSLVSVKRSTLRPSGIVPNASGLIDMFTELRAEEKIFHPRETNRSFGV